MSTRSLPRPSVANASFVTPQLLIGGDFDVRDDELAARQLEELAELGLTHIVDVRAEADDEAWVGELDRTIRYLWHGVDDAGQRIPDSWFDTGVGWVLEALADPDAVVLTHCHMGINRGPSLGYAVLLAQGWDPVDALDIIRTARRVAYVAYAEQALAWHHRRTAATEAARRDDRNRLAAWRREHALDLVRVIAEQRRAGK